MTVDGYIVYIYSYFKKKEKKSKFQISGDLELGF